MTVDEDIVEWHKKTFPDVTMDSQLKKLDEEIGELCEAIKAGVKNHAVKEVADVYIVSRVLADRFNSWIGNYFLGLLDEYPVPRMMSEVEKKMEINKNRIWHKVDGVYRHKEEE